MSSEQHVIGRRRLLLLSAAATAGACSSSGDPLGGPYGGTTDVLPDPILGDSGGSGSGGGSGSSGGSSSSGGSGSSSGSSGGTNSEGGACGGCATGTVVTLSFAQYPQLQTPGGSVTTVAPGYADPTCGLNGIVVFNNGGTYGALSNSCTHACCNVAITGSELLCPCHGATYDLSGMPTNNVSKTPLPSLPVCSDSCGVYVTA